MSDLFDDPDSYEDVGFAAGCHLIWGFTLEPWDITGSTVAFIVNGTSFPMTISFDGIETSQFSIKLSPTQTAGVGLVNQGDIQAYTVKETFADGTIEQIGHGKVIVT